jgi:hypothetical protein
MTKQAFGVTGLVAGGIHLAFVLYVVGLILFAGEADWPMYWIGDLCGRGYRRHLERFLPSRGSSPSTPGRHRPIQNGQPAH